MTIDSPVTDLMSKSVLTIEKSASLFDVKELFDRKKIKHLPITENGKLVGILSLTDIMRLSFGDTYGEDQAGVDNVVYDMLTIDEVMKGKPICIRSDQTIREAAEIFSKNEFHALPVIEHDELVGIITTTDIIQFLLKNY